MNECSTDNVHLQYKHELTRTFGVFPFCRIRFRRMPCELFFPSFSFLIPFINATVFMDVNEMLVKYITVTVSVRVSVTVMVSLV